MLSLSQDPKKISYILSENLVVFLSHSTHSSTFQSICIFCRMGSSHYILHFFCSYSIFPALLLKQNCLMHLSEKNVYSISNWHNKAFWAFILSIYLYVDACKANPAFFPLLFLQGHIHTYISWDFDELCCKINWEYWTSVLLL